MPKAFRHRLALLSKACDGGLDTLKEIGVRYHAPLDFSAERPEGSYDLIYSISVFEHISPEVLSPILDNLVRTLTPSGCMLNDIHLEDHLDMDAAPFAFLCKDSGYSASRDADTRGNGIRLSEWQRIFDGVQCSATRVVSKVVRSDCRPAAEELLPEFARLDPEDCFTARIVTKTVRV